MTSSGTSWSLNCLFIYCHWHWGPVAVVRSRAACSVTSGSLYLLHLPYLCLSENSERHSRPDICPSGGAASLKSSLCQKKKSPLVGLEPLRHEPGVWKNGQEQPAVGSGLRVQGGGLLGRFINYPTRKPLVSSSRNTNEIQNENSSLQKHMASFKQRIPLIRHVPQKINIPRYRNHRLSFGKKPPLFVFHLLRS